MISKREARSEGLFLRGHSRSHPPGLVAKEFARGHFRNRSRRPASIRLHAYLPAASRPLQPTGGASIMGRDHNVSMPRCALPLFLRLLAGIMVLGARPIAEAATSAALDQQF